MSFIVEGIGIVISLEDEFFFVNPLLSITICGVTDEFQRIEDKSLGGVKGFPFLSLRLSYSVALKTEAFNLSSAILPSPSTTPSCASD